MNIQPCSTMISAYSKQQSLTTTLSSTESITSSSTMDTVSISKDARELAINSVNVQQMTSSTSAWLSKIAHEDSNFAESFTKAMVNDPARILYDAASAYNPPLRFGISKEIVTPEKLAEFQSASESIVAGRVKIYTAELAKGTSYADILDKLMSYNDSLPEEYNKMTGWGHVDGNRVSMEMIKAGK